MNVHFLQHCSYMFACRSIELPYLFIYIQCARTPFTHAQEKSHIWCFIPLVGLKHFCLFLGRTAFIHSDIIYTLSVFITISA